MLKKNLLIVAILTFLAACSVFAAADAKDLVGSYKTEIDMNGKPAQTFTLVVKMDASGKISATAEKANDDVAVESIATEGANVTLGAKWRGVPFEMRGKIEKDRIAGDWGTGQYSGEWRAVRVKE